MEITAYLSVLVDKTGDEGAAASPTVAYICLRARRHPPGGASDGEAATTQARRLPTEAGCQETLLPGFLFAIIKVAAGAFELGRGVRHAAEGAGGQAERRRAAKRYYCQAKAISQHLSHLVLLHFYAYCSCCQTRIDWTRSTVGVRLGRR